MVTIRRSTPRPRRKRRSLPTSRRTKCRKRAPRQPHARSKTAPTARQAAVYDFIRDRIDTFGFPPSVREIAKQFGIRSPNGVICHLKALERRGLIVRGRDQARAIRLVDRSSARQALMSLLDAIDRVGGRIKRQPEYQVALRSFE